MLEPTIYIPSRLTKFLAADPDTLVKAAVEAEVNATIGPCPPLRRAG
jgi:hypothetical protein